MVGHAEVETPAGVKFSTYGLPVTRDELGMPTFCARLIGCRRDFLRVNFRPTRGFGMRKCALVAILSAAMVACCGVSANACGDKLLVLGRGIRLETLLGNRTAKILAYQHAGTHGAELIADPEFQSALKNAGYQLHIVRDTEELEVALRLGKYDLLISDIADTDAVEHAAQSVSSLPALLPILYQPTKAELVL